MTCVENVDLRTSGKLPDEPQQSRLETEIANFMISSV